jgi:hypothetical protein
MRDGPSYAGESRVFFPAIKSQGAAVGRFTELPRAEHDPTVLHRRPQGPSVPSGAYPDAVAASE